jgi:carboxylate-amine ligase
MLFRLRRSNQRWRTYARMLLMENRWRAMRYSFDEGLVDLGRGAIVPHAENLGELIELIREDAEALGCTAEVEHA